MAKAVGIVAAIGDQTTSRVRRRRDQVIGNKDVADIAGREPNDRWATQNIGQDMDFCGLTATR